MKLKHFSICGNACGIADRNNVKFRVVWDVTPCSHIGVDWRFRVTYCLHYRGWWWRQYAPPKRLSLQWDHTALHPRRLKRHTRRRENLISHKLNLFCPFLIPIALQSLVVIICITYFNSQKSCFAHKLYLSFSYGSLGKQWLIPQIALTNGKVMFSLRYWINV
jgi:hypothetical protein